MPHYADPALVAQLGQEHSFHVAEDAEIAARLPFAEDVDILTSNTGEAGAVAVAARLMPMGKPYSGGWQMSVPEVLYDIEVGDTIAISAQGLWPGTRPFFVRGRALDTNRGETVFTLIAGEMPAKGQPAGEIP